MKDIRYLFDMDGTLVKWKAAASIEETYEPGYFLDMEADEKMASVLRWFVRNGKKVSILTSVYMETTARAEKKEWLARNGFEDVDIIFVPYGKNKFDYINQDEFNVLIDDYSQNLHRWKNKGGLCFKYFNGVNGTNGTWRGYGVSFEMPTHEITTEITAISEKEAERLA